MVLEQVEAKLHDVIKKRTGLADKEIMKAFKDTKVRKSIT